MRKWHRYVPAASAVTAVAVIVEVLNASQRW